MSRKYAKDYRDNIDEMKRIFDMSAVKRLHVDDEFFMKLIQAAHRDDITSRGLTNLGEQREEIDLKAIHNVYMEIMVNIEGICNELKGKTRFNRYSFGLDIRRLPMGVFLTEAKILVRDREYKKSDFIIFYDDTNLRTGSRGFAITRDEIITNVSGMFRVLRFADMTTEPEFVEGLKRDVFRIHFEDKNFDVKVLQKVKHTAIVYDVLKLLYKYSRKPKK